MGFKNLFDSWRRQNCNFYHYYCEVFIYMVTTAVLTLVIHTLLYLTRMTAKSFKQQNKQAKNSTSRSLRHLKTDRYLRWLWSGGKLSTSSISGRYPRWAVHLRRTPPLPHSRAPPAPPPLLPPRPLLTLPLQTTATMP
jgi:hypothetical protein